MNNQSIWTAICLTALSAVGFAQIPNYVPSEGLLAWYNFDGDASDASDNSHNGAVFGASFVESSLNGAASFDGSDDYLEIPTSPVFEDLVHELTLSAWFRKTNANTGTIMAKRNFVGNPCGERHHFELTCMPDNSVLFSASHNCIELHHTQVQSAPDVFELNVWTHVVVTYDNGALLMYVDGEVVVEHDEGYRELLPNNHWINFGRIHRSGGNPFFNEYGGEIDESGIWNRVLLPMEIQSLHQGIESPAISGCMDEAACNFDPEATEDDGSCLPELSIELSAGSLCVGDSVLATIPEVFSPVPSISYPIETPSDAIFVSAGVVGGDGSTEFPFGTIQEGINAAQNGDVVCVLPGTYTGSGNKNLSPQGKAIVIQSLHGPASSIIDCEQDGRGFVLNSGESMSTVIRGFSILNGKPLSSPYGGSGVFVEDNSGVLITHCIFRSGQSYLGESVSAIQFGDTEVSGPQSGVSQCVFETTSEEALVHQKSYFCHESIFRNNTEHSSGNGHVANPAQEWRNCIWMNNTNTYSMLGLGHGKRLENSLFISNETGRGLVYMGTNWSGMNTIDHCTFWDNTSGYYSSGWYDHEGEVRSSIFANGGDARNQVSGNQNIIDYYSSIGPGLSGNNNQSGSVEFVNVDGLDFTPTSNSIAIGAGEGGSNAGCDMSLFPEWMLSWIRASENAGSSNEEFSAVWNNGQSGLSAWYNSSQTGTVSVSVNGLCEAVTTLELGIEGCTDSTAINFNALATCPDESCVFQGCNDASACNYEPDDLSTVDCVYPLMGDDCEAGAVACATGTVWDAESQTCVVATLPYLNAPGEIAELNPCYFDTNYNGLVDVTDLMNLLSVYSTSCAWEE